MNMTFYKTTVIKASVVVLAASSASAGTIDIMLDTDSPSFMSLSIGNLNPVEFRGIQGTHEIFVPNGVYSRMMVSVLGEDKQPIRAAICTTKPRNSEWANRSTNIDLDGADKRISLVVTYEKGQFFCQEIVTGG